LGTAAFGSIFTNRLGTVRLSGAQVEQLGGPAKLAYEQAFVHALTPVFFVAACVAAVGFALSWLLPEKPLRATAGTSTGLEDGLAAPRAADSLAEIERALSELSTLEERRRFRSAVAERAGLSVSPGGVWALVRVAQDGLQGAIDEAHARGVSDERIAEVEAELRADALIDDDGVTARGSAYADQLVAARREVLCEELDDPEAERDPEVERLLSALARELVGEPS
jgi:hypothetical protein